MPRTHIPQLARRLAAALAFGLAATAALAPGASASYNVHACDTAASGANRSWSIQSTAPELHLTAFTKCYTLTPDPYGDMQQGVGVFDTLDSDGGALVPNDGRYAEQRFTAPAGTRITGAAITRDIGNRDYFWRNYGRIDGVDQGTETCFPVAGEAFCRTTGLKTFSGLNAQTIAYGARCDSTDPHCPNGSTLHMVWALVLGASVTLDDIEAPTVSTPTTTGLADGTWHRGTGTITFTADDNTGIRVRRLVEGATTRATAIAPNAGAGGCGTLNSGAAYTYLQPCAGTRGLNGTQAVTVADVCAWGDGEHAIRAAAEDTGSTSTRSTGTVTVRVDCTAPAVTVGPSAQQNVEAGQMVLPEVTATDERSVASTEIEYQVGLYGPWQSYTGPITAQAGSSYRFRARATDSVGNTSAWSAASAWTHGESAQQSSEAELSAARPSTTPITPRDQDRDQDPSPAPAPPLTPLLAFDAPTARVTDAKFTRRTRTLHVRGTAAGAATVVLRIRTNASKRLTRRAKVRNGRFAVTIRLSKRVRRARVVGIRVQPLR